MGLYAPSYALFGPPSLLKARRPFCYVGLFRAISFGFGRPRNSRNPFAYPEEGRVATCLGTNPSADSQIRIFCLPCVWLVWKEFKFILNSSQAVPEGGCPYSITRDESKCSNGVECFTGAIAISAPSRSAAEWVRVPDFVVAPCSAAAVGQSCYCFGNPCNVRAPLRSEWDMYKCDCLDDQLLLFVKAMLDETAASVLCLDLCGQGQDVVDNLCECLLDEDCIPAPEALPCLGFSSPTLRAREAALNQPQRQSEASGGDERQNGLGSLKWGKYDLFGERGASLLRPPPSEDRFQCRQKSPLLGAFLDSRSTHCIPPPSPSILPPALRIHTFDDPEACVEEGEDVIFIGSAPFDEPHDGLSDADKYRYIETCLDMRWNMHIYVYLNI